MKLNKVVNAHRVPQSNQIMQIIHVFWDLQNAQEEVREEFKVK